MSQSSIDSLHVLPFRFARLVQSSLEIVYSAGILLLLLTFGGVYAIPKALALMILSLVAAIAVLTKPVPTTSAVIFYWTFAIFTVLVVWIILQMTHLPGEIGANPIWAMAAELGVHGTPMVSIAPGETLEGLMTLATPFIAFLAALMIFDTDARVQHAFRIAAYLLSVIVVFGLVQHILFPDTLLFSEKRSYKGSLTSVFVNRNTAGTFLGITAMVMAVWFVEVSKTARLSYNFQRFANGLPMHLERVHAEVVTAGAMFLLSVLSLFLTLSRGAMAAFIGAFATLILLAAIYPIDFAGERGAPRHRPSLGKRLLRAALVLGCAAVVLAIFGGRTILRAQIAGAEDGRFCVLPGIIEMANDHWLTGWGFGTFRWSFPAYRDPECGIYGTWVRAHNAYLEAYAGLGIMFWTVLLVALVVLLRAYWLGLKHRRSLRLYAQTGLSGLVLVLLHSAIDFSIQIPGFAVVFAFFCALTVTISVGKQRNRAKRGKSRSATPSLTDH